MEYYVKSVVPIIESNYDKFTTVERNIADFYTEQKKVDFHQNPFPRTLRIRSVVIQICEEMRISRIQRIHLSV